MRFFGIVNILHKSKLIVKLSNFLVLYLLAVHLLHRSMFQNAYR